MTGAGARRTLVVSGGGSAAAVRGMTKKRSSAQGRRVGEKPAPAESVRTLVIHCVHRSASFGDVTSCNELCVLHLNLELCNHGPFCASDRLQANAS